jgi:hypothetical protein
MVRELKGSARPALRHSNSDHTRLTKTDNGCYVGVGALPSPAAHANAGRICS